MRGPSGRDQYCGPRRRAVPSPRGPPMSSLSRSQAAWNEFADALKKARWDKYLAMGRVGLA